MIKILNIKDDLELIEIYYKSGIRWMFANTFEEYKRKREKVLGFKPYCVWDLESLLKNDNIYIRINDMFEMTSTEYIRKLKLKRIL
jgi:hypothetical protein